MDTQSHYPVSLPSFSEPLLSIGSPNVRPLTPPNNPSSGATSHNRKNTQSCRKKRKDFLCGQGVRFRPATTIGMLPDDVLLEIFDFCQKQPRYATVWRWHLLVHACQRWRQIIFGSAHRLNLEILCTRGTPVRKNLGIWPVLPIVVDYGYSWSGITPNDEDNVMAALEHPDRVCFVRLYVTGSQLEKMAAVMQVPFPVLTHLEIFSVDGNAPVLPAGFSGGSAPCLQKINLHGIPFPATPTLLFSASDLVDLTLDRIPSTGYISPEVVAGCLAALPRLDSFFIEFQSATRPERMRRPPITRAVLPALTSFQFKGASEYLEDLVSRIESPQLNGIDIHYLNQLIDFRVVQLSMFIDRSLGPESTPFKRAGVAFFSNEVTFEMYRRVNHPPWHWRSARTTISCEGIDWQVSHIAQVLSQFSTSHSNVIHLKLDAEPEGLQLNGIDDAEWLHLFHQSPTVRTLHVSQELSGHVALALEDLTGDMVAEVLPSLDLIFLVGQPASSVEKFVAARRLSDRPVAIIDTESEFDERLESYVSE